MRTLAATCLPGSPRAISALGAPDRKIKPGTITALPMGLIMGMRTVEITYSGAITSPTVRIIIHTLTRIIIRIITRVAGDHAGITTHRDIVHPTAAIPTATGNPKRLNM
jgi:hypothetical protein